VRRPSGSFKSFRVLVPGSISNLGCGFESLGLAVSLYFKTTVRPATTFDLQTCCNGRPMEIPDAENLFLKVLRCCYPVSPDDWHFSVDIDTEVPPRRGLGSSACAVLSALITAARMMCLPLEPAQMLKTAMQWEPRPDNLCAGILGGFVAAMQEECGAVAVSRLPFPKTLKILLLIPQWEIPAHEACRLLPALYPRQTVVSNLQRLAFFLASLQNGEFQQLAESVRDQIHQPYRVPLIPFARDLLESGEFPKETAVFISGAGPAFAMLYRVHEKRIRAAAQRIMSRHPISYELFPVLVDKEGARVEQLED
jgi:homoserine kinase